ncbi:GDSL-type esterase/lipase family protein [Botryobacter ruber]|uniref:GDSL-type esterase/lipase family protein n=1 Tax=Botryobacter ruber TaxID=2171629 RepID=UPI000E0CA9E6|nr:GDSL-type esterase/lipase family protein [Botryobacter ruber]
MKHHKYHPYFLLLVLQLCLLSGEQLFAQQQKDLNIVFIGNSITRGSGLANRETEAAPVHAVAYLQHHRKIGEVKYSNQGVGGYTTVNFLPATNTAFRNVTKAADAFSADSQATLVFSIMLGTNDSAIEGPKGAPVTPAEYRTNLKALADQLLTDYPNSVLVFHRPLWYSPNTQNSGAKYLQEGLNRLQSYYPELEALVASYRTSHPDRVFLGDKKASGFFRKHHQSLFQHEKGKQGIFYLHPNKEGAVKLGQFWGKAIRKAVL